MKQHITVEQIEELSENQRDKLADWWIEKDKVGSYGLLSIGQMIEFLVDHGEEYFLLTNGLNGLFNPEHKNLWKAGTGDENTPLQKGQKFADNPCDALWEAVKEGLK